jgi:hypothetical protein
MHQHSIFTTDRLLTLSPHPLHSILNWRKILYPCSSLLHIFLHVPHRCQNKTFCSWDTYKYEGASESFRPGCLEWEMQMVQIFATRFSCIIIFLSQFSVFCCHNPLCCFSSVYRCKSIFCYWLNPETFGCTLIQKTLPQLIYKFWKYKIHQLTNTDVSPHHSTDTVEQHTSSEQYCL